MEKIALNTIRAQKLKPILQYHNLLLEDLTYVPHTNHRVNS